MTTDPTTPTGDAAISEILAWLRREAEDRATQAEAERDRLAAEVGEAKAAIAEIRDMAHRGESVPHESARLACMHIMDHIDAFLGRAGEGA